MENVLPMKKILLEIVDDYYHRYELSKTVGQDYFEPGMMENLDQYFGLYNEDANIITLRFGLKGLRYDNRTQNIEKLGIGDSVTLVRDNQNVYNSNNFLVMNKQDSLGTLPAELCDALAPLYDSNNAEILDSKVSYIEKLKDRSRYAKQGVLFVELKIRLNEIQPF